VANPLAGRAAAAEHRPMTQARSIDRQVLDRARRIVAVTLVAFGIAGPAGGQAPADPAPSAEASFVRADLNKDGKLSKQEAATLPAIAARFEQLDKDKDGSLTLDEFLSGYVERR
jgi:hypothetical protein